MEDNLYILTSHKDKLYKYFNFNCQLLIFFLVLLSNEVY